MHMSVSAVLKSHAKKIEADREDEAGDDACYHGGQSWEASKFNFDVRDSLIVADVLDSPFPPCPEALDVIREQLERCCQESPPTQCEELIETIAEVRGVPSRNVAVSSGSSSLMFSLLPQLLNTRLVEDLQPVALVELDHLGVPHRHDVGAATLNHEFQGVAHQPERQVLAPVCRRHREPPDLKSGVLGVSAGGKRRSFEHVAREIGRQAKRLAFRRVEADVADQIVALNARDEMATGVFKDAISVRVVLMQLVGVDVVANC